MCAGTALREESSHLQERVALCAHGKVKSASRGVHGKRALEVSSSIGKGQEGQEHPELWAWRDQEQSHSSGGSLSSGPGLGTAPAVTAIIPGHSTGSCPAPARLPSSTTRGFFSQFPLRVGHQLQQHERPHGGLGESQRHLGVELAHGAHPVGSLPSAPAFPAATGEQGRGWRGRGGRAGDPSPGGGLQGSAGSRPWLGTGAQAEFPLCSTRLAGRSRSARGWSWAPWSGAGPPEATDTDGHEVQL